MSLILFPNLSAYNMNNQLAEFEKNPSYRFYFSEMTLIQVRSPPGGGGDSHMKQTGCSSEILNLTPKEDHLGVAQGFCDP